MTLMIRRAFITTLLLTGIGLPSVVRAQGSPQAGGAVTLFENVRNFDGKGAALSASSMCWSAQRHRAHFDYADCGHAQWLGQIAVSGPKRGSSPGRPSTGICFFGRHGEIRLNP